MKIKDPLKIEYEIAIKNNTPPCGVGSVARSVVQSGTVDYIKNLVKRYNIISINDCPCGLYENWINLVDLPNLGVKYRGYDINDLVVNRNKEKYPNLEFFEFHMCEEILPSSDLIICRDCLFHFPNDLVIKTLNNFRESKSTYLLATHQQWVEQNENLPPHELANDWGYRELNVEIAPYNLGTPIESHIEKMWNRSMSLWKLQI